MATPEKLKNIGIVLGKFLYKAAEAGLESLRNMQAEYDSAQERLDRQGIDEWDENKLKQRMNYTGNFYEQSIIRQKLSDKVNEHESDE